MTDPCAGCTLLRPGPLRPTCARGAFYGDAKCVRGGRQPSRPLKPLPPEQYEQNLLAQGK